jgi:hypothetical protein
MNDSTFTLHTDSISSQSWIDGNQTSYVSYLNRPIENIESIEILSLSANVLSTTNVVYLFSDQFISRFNQVTGVVSTNNTSSIVSDPTTKGRLEGSLARFPVVINNNRLIHTTNANFPTDTHFDTPIPTVDRITTRLFDERGVALQTTSNVFVTYRIKTKSKMLVNADPSYLRSLREPGPSPVPQRQRVCPPSHKSAQKHNKG